MMKKYQFETAGDVVSHFVTSGMKFGEFQRLCADLCEAMGFKVKKRSKADGTMKLELRFGEETGTIECFCYKPEVEVSRADVSRISRENPDMDATHIVLFTTSRFSPGALAYCQGTGIRAVDAEHLVGLMRKHGFIMERHVEVVEPDPEEPKDLRERKTRVVQQVREEKPKVVPKSPLAAKASVQSRKPQSQRFDARAYLRGDVKVKPFR